MARVGETTRQRFALFYLPLTLFLLFTLFPFYWMFITSIRSNHELYNRDLPPFWARACANTLKEQLVTLDFDRDAIIEDCFYHWRYLWYDTLFGRWLQNTLFIAFCSTLISLFCGISAGYALARLRFQGAGIIGILIFVTYLVPPTLLFIPLSDVLSTLKLLNSRFALILSYPTFLVPFCTWLLTGYFKTIPRELEECAMIDGATRIQAMVKIVMPLALPGILSAGIFAFTLSANEFLYALTFIFDNVNKTVPVGVVSELIRGDVFYWGELMSGALLGSIPVALIYSFFVEHYVAGMTGAIKG